jgi:hypothetical protein
MNLICPKKNTLPSSVADVVSFNLYVASQHQILI